MSRLGICVSIDVLHGGRRDPRELDFCEIEADGGEPIGRWCWAGGVCAGHLPYPGGWNGYCVREEYCDEVDAYIEGITCVWSDRSVRRTGAPRVEECPPADERARFCGGPCGDCPWPDPFPIPFEEHSYSVACIGRSDRRGLGVCAANSDVVCTPSRSADRVCNNFAEDPSLGAFAGEPCACVVLEDPNVPGRFPEWGWATLAESCLRYQALYPEQVRCYDADWSPL